MSHRSRSSKRRGRITRTARRKSRTVSPRALPHAAIRRPTFSRSRRSSRTCTASISRAGMPASSSSQSLRAASPAGRGSGRVAGDRPQHRDPEVRGECRTPRSRISSTEDQVMRCSRRPRRRSLRSASTGARSPPMRSPCGLRHPACRPARPRFGRSRSRATIWPRASRKSRIATRRRREGMVTAAEGGLKYWQARGHVARARARGIPTREEPAAGRGACARPSDVGAAMRRPLRGERRPGRSSDSSADAVLAIAQRRDGDRPAFEASRQRALEQYAMIAADEREWCESDRRDLEG